MTDDPRSFIRAVRPQMPANGNIRPISTGEINGRPLDELSTNPASPTYRSKVPPPPCHRCGEDHIPNRSYDHAWEAEPSLSSQPVVEAAQVTPAAAPPALPALTHGQRVAVYVGRNDLYIVAVETAPEWDTQATFKCTEETLLLMIHLARALNVKVQDKTGGDLAA